MTPRTTLLRILPLVACLLAGCASWSSMPPLSVGPITGGPSTFAQVQTLMQSRGYQVLQSNPATGMVQVQSSSSNWRATYTLTVQCYREGWISIIPGGPGVRRVGPQWSMPSGLASEYLDLSMALTSALPRTQGGAQ